ncbi:MAG: O-antigen ligase family protein [bacterium]|jgi:O-antigen ligase
MLPREGRALVTPPAAIPERTALLDRLGFLLTLVFLFLTLSRVSDLLVPSMHLPAITGGGALLAGLLTRKLFRGLAFPAGKALCAMTVWMMFALPFSVWRGGSMDTLIAWLKAFAVYGMLAAFVPTLEQLRTAVNVVAAAILVLGLSSLVAGSSDSGRLAFERVKFGNPNDLAQMLLIGLPMWWLIASRPWRSLAGKLLAFGLSAPLLVAFVRTGSRGGLIGFAAVLAFLCLTGGAKRAVAIGLGAVILAGAAFVALPGEVRQRFFLLFGGPGESIEGGNPYLYETATASAQQRWVLLKDSLLLTARNPLLGVGPGQFTVAQRDLAGARGEYAAWRVTHNSYTQVSSENGIPALFFYAAAILSCLRTFRRAARLTGNAQAKELASTGLFLTLSLVAYIVSALFASVAYDLQLPMLAGLAAALAFLMGAEVKPSARFPMYVRSRAGAPAAAKRAAAAAGGGAR